MKPGSMRLNVAGAVVDGALVRGDVEVADGRIAGVGLATPGGGSGIAVPGFVDLQVNGFGGVDFLDADADAYRRAGSALLETGVTAYLPTLITSPEEQLLAAMREIPVNGSYPRVLGVHLEGPFLSPNRMGTHTAAARRDPDAALLERLLDGGPVVLMTLAPELPGADELIRTLVARGVRVSLGHTDATAEQANRAFDLGAVTVTHLFNAMRPFRHRDPGVVGAALVRDGVIVQVIIDGIHLAPETVKLVWRSAAGRVSLVTDAITATGVSDDGSWSFGDFDVDIHDGEVRNPAGVLAGTTLTMVEAVRNLHGLGVPIEEAVAAATSVPASVLGLPETGRLAPGLPADVVVLTDDVEIERVLVAGEVQVAV
ncbi:MAG TPA: N-acetylglucosamine-6-phosphate deacetylase [Gaiellaceae bacterium]|nr:N-acetylglucosamine-6-phosphate deacetylase [Gaiellaceae bacterium]